MSNFKIGDLVKLLDSEDIYVIYEIGNLKFTNEEIATIYLHKGTSNKIKLEVYTKDLVKVNTQEEIKGLINVGKIRCNITMNSIIIDNVTLTINNFNNTGKSYRVYAFAQNTQDNDQYTITVVTLDREGYDTTDKYFFYIDSCGGTTNDIPSDDLTDFVINTLFSKKDTLIRGF